MSSNRTEHYGLCQWEAGDQVIRTDFNEDNARLDGALAGQAEAITALTEALEKKGNCRIETFTVRDGVRHNNSNPLVIQFSAVPAFFVLFDGSSIAFCLGGSNRAFVLYNGPSSAAISGLVVSWSGSRATITNIDYVSSYTEYSLAAFYAQ